MPKPISLVQVEREPVKWAQILEAEVITYESAIARENTAMGYFTGSAGAFASTIVSFLLSPLPENAPAWRWGAFFSVAGLMLIAAIVSYQAWKFERKQRPRMLELIRGGKAG